MDGNSDSLAQIHIKKVAAFTGGVDGNATVPTASGSGTVAAFTGGVDGNIAFSFLVQYLLVAAFTGGVDGNSGVNIQNQTANRRRLHGRRGLKFLDGLTFAELSEEVAAFTGGVDGNIDEWIFSERDRVAAFTGGVDGNIDKGYIVKTLDGSPPSRAAWIEIPLRRMYPFAVRSPPSRAAWIEIC